MTSEGGGAVAFPVMTLAFNISPAVARDFSVLIQSCGMTAASASLLLMGIRLEWTALLFCSLGGVAGALTGLHLVDPYVTPQHKKIAFVSIWFASAFALFLLNKTHKRTTLHAIPYRNPATYATLLFVGAIGGVFTSFAGSGLDICSFSVLTLLFRVSEKVATPTSVVLMAVNSVVVSLWRTLILGAVTQDTWAYFQVAIPVVVIGAPFGSFLGSHFHRLVLAALVYILDTVALIGAYCIVPLNAALVISSVSIIVIGFFGFIMLTKLGTYLLNKESKPEVGQQEAELKQVEVAQTGQVDSMVSLV